MQVMGPRACLVVAALLPGSVACGGEPSPTTMICGELRTARSVLPSQCGPTADFTPINRYQGSIGVVQDREDAVVLVNGGCTGTLVAAGAGPVVLTAGHCVGLGDRSLLAFNVEAEPDGDPLVTNGTVIEQAIDPDYALIQLDKIPSITPTALTSQVTDLLAIIQHPRGGPKVIAEGSFLADCQASIAYADLDTLVGSSGAGVLNQQGELVAVHTDGDCSTEGGGANQGFTTTAIVAASAYLEDADVQAR